MIRQLLPLIMYQFHIQFYFNRFNSSDFNEATIACSNDTFNVVISTFFSDSLFDLRYRTKYSRKKYTTKNK